MRMELAAEALAAAVDPLLNRAKRLAPRQADHLERAVDSVLFNMAEGIASFTPRMKLSAYEIARKEANEARAVLRRLVIRGVFSEAQTRNAYQLAGACVAMLTRAAIAIDNRRAEQPP